MPKEKRTRVPPKELANKEIYEHNPNMPKHVYANVFQAVSCHILKAGEEILNDLELVLDEETFTKIRGRVLRSVNDSFRRCSDAIHQDKSDGNETIPPNPRELKFNE